MCPNLSSNAILFYRRSGSALYLDAHVKAYRNSPCVAAGSVTFRARHKVLRYAVDINVDRNR
jgi:hypothetical protein